jgi:hypothetical protein
MLLQPYIEKVIFQQVISCALTCLLASYVFLMCRKQYSQYKVVATL